MAKFNWKSKEEIEEEQRIAELEQEMEQEAEQQEAERQRAIEEFVALQAEEWMLNADVPEEEKKRFKAIFEPFKVGVAYQVGDKVNFRGDVYEVIQTHTSQADWLPPQVPALFQPFLQEKTEDGTPVVHEWVQPTGAHDAYDQGDTVSYDGKVWESTAANNVWVPGVYGWKIIEE